MNPRAAIALIACCLGFAALEARAEGLTVGLHVASIHSPQGDQTNTNPGLYIRMDRWQAGLYRNSHSRTTFYGGYAYPIGPVEVMAGIASGYDKRCTTQTTYIPEKVSFEQYPNGDTSTTTTPARTVPTEACTGFSKHRLTPLVALSFAAPFTVSGARPRLWFMPGFSKTSTVAHLSLEWSV